MHRENVSTPFLSGRIFPRADSISISLTSPIYRPLLIHVLSLPSSPYTRNKEHEPCFTIQEFDTYDQGEAALNAANAECVSNFHKRHPGEGDGDCRVVAVGAMYSNTGYWGAATDDGNHAELGGKNQWQYAWDTFVKPNQYHYAGSQPYDVNTAFTDDPGMSVQKIMARDTYNDINKWNDPIVHITNVNKSIVVIVLDKYQPAPPSFTPTISTNAPHIIQEGQPITDKVTVGVKSGDRWIDGTSVTAKGYYFTGSKDVILKNIPYNGDPTDAGINGYLNQIKSAGGEYPWVAGMGVRCGLNRAALRPVGARPGVKGGPPECRFAPLHAFAYRR